MTPSRRRGHGEGGIRLRQDGLWEARVTLGSVDGKRVRRCLYGRSRKEVVEKLVSILAGIQRGEAPASGSRSLGAADVREIGRQLEKFKCVTS